jgi:exportin-1
MMLVQSVQAGLNYLVQLSNIPEDELFKICMNFWHFFSHDVMIKTKPPMQFNHGSPGDGNLDFSNFATQMATQTKVTMMHQQVYPAVLKDVKIVMIDFMVKPKDVLLTVDESGEVEEEVVEDTEMRELYETMRETLIFLTNQNPSEADHIFQRRLEQLKTDKKFFTYVKLDKLCWALGSISGCLNHQEEERFVIQVIKELLNLCEKTEGKGNKA